MKPTTFFRPWPLAAAALVVLAASTRPAGAVEASPPRTVEAAVQACTRSASGDACAVTIEEGRYSGVCLPFVRGQLVCAIAAPASAP